MDVWPFPGWDDYKTPHPPGQIMIHLWNSELDPDEHGEPAEMAGDWGRGAHKCRDLAMRLVYTGSADQAAGEIYIDLNAVYNAGRIEIESDFSSYGFGPPDAFPHTVDGLALSLTRFDTDLLVCARRERPPHLPDAQMQTWPGHDVIATPVRLGDIMNHSLIVIDTLWHGRDVPWTHAYQGYMMSDYQMLGG